MTLSTSLDNVDFDQGVSQPFIMWAEGMQQKQFLAVLAAGLLLCPTVLLGSLDEADQPRQHMFS